MKTSGFDALVDSLALNLARGTEALVSIESLPFWAKREMVRQRKEHGPSAFPTWTMDEPFENDVQARMENLLKSRFPKAKTVAFVGTEAEVKELTELFLDLADSL